MRVDVTSGGPDAESWLKQHLERRLELNRLIGEYAASKRLAWVDLFTATADHDTQLLAARYSNDGLHLTTAGYQLLARLLFEQVFANATLSDRRPTS